MNKKLIWMIVIGCVFITKGYLIEYRYQCYNSNCICNYMLYQPVDYTEALLTEHRECEGEQTITSSRYIQLNPHSIKNIMRRGEGFGNCE